MSRVDAIREHYGRVAEGGCCGTASFSLGSGDVVGAGRLRAGERVLDLGSGSGHDTLRAADLVGPSGHAAGVDFAPQMVERARATATGRTNVAFYQADVARLPFPDDTFDVVMSNCVVNLAPDKRAVLTEARRVLGPGGRIVLSDIVFVTEPDAAVRADEALVCRCVGGAALLSDYLRWLEEVGLSDVRIVEGHPYGEYGGAAALAVTLVARERDAERSGG